MKLSKIFLFFRNFCPIHLESLEKARYLANKLDGFLVSGHKLIAMDASELIEASGL